MLELGIYFLGGLVLTIFNKLGRDFHRHSFDGVAKSMRTRSCFKLLVPATEIIWSYRFSGQLPDVPRE